MSHSRIILPGFLIPNGNFSLGNWFSRFRIGNQKAHLKISTCQCIDRLAGVEENKNLQSANGYNSPMMTRWSFMAVSPLWLLL
jgi:hypothetical protein